MATRTVLELLHEVWGLWLTCLLYAPARPCSCFVQNKSSDCALSWTMRPHAISYRYVASSVYSFSSAVTLNCMQCQELVWVMIQTRKIRKKVLRWKYWKIFAWESLNGLTIFLRSKRSSRPNSPGIARYHSGRAQKETTFVSVKREGTV